MRTSARLLLGLLAGCAVAAGDDLAAQQSPSLLGSVAVDAPSGQLLSLQAQIGDGGTGPHAAILAGDPSLPTHTLYRPRDLTPFGPSNPMPIVAWANGSCRNNSGEYRNFLAEIASHGFLVIATGPAAHSLVLGSGAPGGGTEASQMLDAIDWATEQNGLSGGEYQGRIATDQVAVMGHSCGGAQALDISKDPRVGTTMVWNSGLFNQPRSGPPAGAAGDGPPARPSSMTAMTKERLSELHAPIAYILGGPGDIAYANGLDDFQRIDHVPVLFASQDVGHYPATFLEPHGGAYGQAAVAWLNWHLRNDRSAAGAFIGDDCGLCSDPAWSVQSKNLQ